MIKKSKTHLIDKQSSITFGNYFLMQYNLFAPRNNKAPLDTAGVDQNKSSS